MNDSTPTPRPLHAMTLVELVNEFDALDKEVTEDGFEASKRATARRHAILSECMDRIKRRYMAKTSDGHGPDKREIATLRAAVNDAKRLGGLPGELSNLLTAAHIVCFRLENALADVEETAGRIG